MCAVFGHPVCGNLLVQSQELNVLHSTFSERDKTNNHGSVGALLEGCGRGHGVRGRSFNSSRSSSVKLLRGSDRRLEVKIRAFQARKRMQKCRSKTKKVW